METVTLGRTGLVVNRDGFGGLPVQRRSLAEGERLLLAAFEAGINFYDTARMYGDSEEMMGRAFRGKRDKVVIASKTLAATEQDFWADLETTLTKLNTDYLDIYQFHTPAFCPQPDDGSGLYEAMQLAKRQGKIRFIGISNHRLKVAVKAVESGLYDTLQFPFNYLSSPEETDLVRMCQKSNLGFIAMKALSGGLLTDVSACRAWLGQYSGVLPIWGLQRQSELDALLAAQKDLPVLTPAQNARIQADRLELAGEFCRGCGYCEPCTVGIDIHNSARMSQLIRRALAADYLTPEWREKMDRIDDCTNCGKCRSHCPYQLDIPALLRKNLRDYRELAAQAGG